MDVRDTTIGSWFEARVENVTRATKGQKNGKAHVKGGNSYKGTNGSLNEEHIQNSHVLDSGASTSFSDYVDDEDVSYFIKYDE